jgi:hypothetical protein
MILSNIYAPCFMNNVGFFLFYFLLEVATRNVAEKLNHIAAFSALLLQIFKSYF